MTSLLTDRWPQPASTRSWECLTNPFLLQRVFSEPWSLSRASIARLRERCSSAAAGAGLRPPAGLWLAPSLPERAAVLRSSCELSCCL